MRIFLKTEDEIKLMHNVNQLVGATLGELAKHIKSGVTVYQLNLIAEEFIRDNGAAPAFNMNVDGVGCSSSVCVTVNGVEARGILDAEAPLRGGDVVSVSCGVVKDGFNGYANYTFCVGEPCQYVRQMLMVAKGALHRGIDNAVAGRHLCDISAAIQKHCGISSLGVIGQCVGFGIGRDLFEAPIIPIGGRCGRGILLKEGMCITIAPVITLSRKAVRAISDRWTFKSREKKPTVCFGHTVVVRRGKAEILSSFDEVEQFRSKQ